MTTQGTAASTTHNLPATESRSDWYVIAMEHLVSVVQDLSHARDIDSITAIVRDAARELTGADGATFVLRDGDECYYADENAIGPLWKGQRFPMNACISGWVMMHKTPAVIGDIYKDPRVPVDAYRPTFVKSLVMVPIRRHAPIGAIGNYWANQRMPSEETVSILQALADTASVAIENAQLYAELRSKVETLQESNYELNRFAWIASHDLQEPLRTIVTQVEMLRRRYGSQLDARAAGYITMVTQSAGRLQELVDNLLVHARTQKIEKFRPLSLGTAIDAALKSLDCLIQGSGATIGYKEPPWVWGDPALLTRLIENLLTNAIKFQKPGQRPRIRIAFERDGSQWRVAVADNGIGIEATYHQRVFELFRRLHSQDVYAGSGIGLATCRKIIELHGGKIWVESRPGEGSTFYFTVPAPDNVNQAIYHITE